MTAEDNQGKIYLKEQKNFNESENAPSKIISTHCECHGKALQNPESKLKL